MFFGRNRYVLMFVLVSTLIFGFGFSQVTAHPALQDDLDGLHLIGNVDGGISVYAPETWVFQSLPANQVYASTLLIAENPALLADVVNYQLAQPTSGTAEGGFAILTRLAPEFWASYAANADQAVTITLQLIVSDLPVYEEFTIEIGADGYNATIVETVINELNAQGYLGGFAHDGDLYLFSLMSAPGETFDDTFGILETIGASISVPAEPGALTDPSQVQPTPVATAEAVVTPEVLPTEAIVVTEESPVAPVQVDAEAGALSILLPDQWFFQDRTSDDGLFVYGSTEAAVNARLYALRPALFEASVAMSGIGGVIELYNLADFGLTPTNPDVSGLMSQVLDNLGQQGYEVVEEAAAMSIAGAQGQLAVIRGSEVGFLALVPFQDQLAYITGTGTADNFEANRDVLLTIVESIRVPAEVPEPTATPQPGLSGLNGLRGAESTETPSAGLGGLGGLRGGDATEEAIDEAATEEVVEED